MNCIHCGQDEAVVRFRKTPDGYTRHTCLECERDFTLARRAGKPVPTKPRESRPVVTKPVIPSKQELKEQENLRRELELLKSIHPTSPATIEPAEPIEGSAIACLMATDWHVEESVELAKMHGLNCYNLQIAEQRAQNFFRNGLRLTNIFSASSAIDTMFLYFGGDFITNYLHEENRETNLLGPAEAANYAMKLLNDGITFLLKNSSYKLIIDCVPGNHGRMTMKMHKSHATETSLETFMYQSLAQLYKDEPRVTFRVANSKMLYRKFFEDFTVRMIHGDDISYGGGIGGITIPIRKKIAAWDKAVRADLTLMGHFHQRIDGGDFLVNGSLIGYNEYAQAIGASPEEACQLFFLLHERNGGQKAIVAPVWLD